MELTLEVNLKTIEKIKAFSKLSGKGSGEILEILSNSVDNTLDSELITITNNMLENLGVKTSNLSSLSSSGRAIHGVSSHALGTSVDGKVTLEGSETNEKVVHTMYSPPKEKTASKGEEEDFSLFELGDEDEDYNESVASGLGGDEANFDDLDQELPQEVIEDILPEKAMPTVKNKEGEEDSYEDDFMNDIQSEIDEDDIEDSVIAAAAASNRKPSPDSEVRGNDAPTGEEGYIPDILPVDLGIDKVSGDRNMATEFFVAALEGKSGDKANRDKITRKRIKTY